MKAKTIYGIFASDYEGSFIQAAFVTRKDAEIMLDSVKAYDITRPDLADSDASEEAFEKSWKRLKRWEKKHPLGRDAALSKGYDFSIGKVKLYSSTEAPHA